jgi:hypothetical protein
VLYNHTAFELLLPILHFLLFLLTKVCNDNHIEETIKAKHEKVCKLFPVSYSFGEDDACCCRNLISKNRLLLVLMNSTSHCSYNPSQSSILWFGLMEHYVHINIHTIKWTLRRWHMSGTSFQKQPQPMY